MTRIIGIGNRLFPPDDVGPRVCDCLTARALPPEVEVIDGGLGGLRLLPLVEEAAHVVFIDGLSGWTQPGEVVRVPPDRAARTSPESYDHQAGLAYLLRVLPLVCKGALPRLDIIGVEVPAKAESVVKAADLALTLAARRAAPASWSGGVT